MHCIICNYARASEFLQTPGIIGNMSTNILAIILIILSGFATGMLVNYLADVLPIQRKLVRPFCINCQTTRPLKEYFLFWRRCANCGEKRSWRVYLVIVVLVFLALYLWQDQRRDLAFIPSLIWMAFFGVVTVIDVEHRLILLPVSIFGIILGLITGVWLHGLYNTIIGGLIGFACMLVFYLLGIVFVKLVSWLRGPMMDDVALGDGDVFLSTVIGLLLGRQAIVWALLITLLLAGFISFIYMVFMKLRGLYRHDLALPFGPFLVSSAMLLLFLKELIYSIWRLF